MPLALLVVLALAPRVLRADPAPVRDRGLAAAPIVGIVVALVWTFWLGPLHLTGPWTGADFPSYCTSLESLRHGRTAPWYEMRAVSSGLLPAVFSTRLGVVDGLAFGSIVAAFGVGAGLYAWGWAVGGWPLGVAIVGMASALAPMTILPRSLSFYPEITAALVLGTAATACAARLRTPAALVGGAVGVGLCMLIDARGLLWGLADLVVLLLAVPFSRGSWPARLAAVVVPIGVAWALGGPAYAPSLSLGQQVARMQQFNGLGVAPPTSAEPWKWGTSAPWALPSALLRIAELTRSGEAAFRRSAFQQGMYDHQVLPWVPVVAGAAVVALWALRRRPVDLAVVVVTGAPFAVALRSAVVTEPADRFLAIGGPVVALVLALAWVGLVGEGRRRVVLGLVLLLGAVAGMPPTWLAPHAAWRVALDANPEAVNAARAATGTTSGSGPPLAPVCAQALHADAQLHRGGWLVR